MSVVVHNSPLQLHPDCHCSTLHTLTLHTSGRFSHTAECGVGWGVWSPSIPPSRDTDPAHTTHVQTPTANLHKEPLQPHRATPS